MTNLTKNWPKKRAISWINDNFCVSNKVKKAKHTKKIVKIVARKIMGGGCFLLAKYGSVCYNKYPIIAYCHLFCPKRVA